MSKKNAWKNREGVVYSTASDYDYQYQQEEQANTLPAAQQRLRVIIDKSGRAGKQVTLISGFVGTADDLAKLAKLLKTKCGVGGSAKDGEIVIQGDVREKVSQLLQKEGYKVSR